MSARVRGLGSWRAGVDAVVSSAAAVMTMFVPLLLMLLLSGGFLTNGWKRLFAFVGLFVVLVAAFDDVVVAPARDDASSRPS